MIIIMLGAPGTGKGTVASILSEKLNIPQVSTGDIFRKNIAEQTELGKLADSYISKGNLVPDDVTIKIVEDRLKQDDVKEGIILDGFPRTIKQAEELDKILEKENKKVDMVINLTTPKEEIIERIVNRRVCSNQECKTVYNIVLNPPKVEGICDKCGSKLLQRKDDNVETVESRIDTYLKNTSPLVEYYTKQNKISTQLVSKTVNKLGANVAKDILEQIK
ncbi:MAG TPA: adenylate kinase [Clostridiaceae bacterium]|nr:adenylate kinase [Clostridiaceae bacterium]